jgi:hypothetical protein
VIAAGSCINIASEPKLHAETHVAAYDALEDEFALASALIKARNKSL